MTSCIEIMCFYGNLAVRSRRFLFPHRANDARGAYSFPPRERRSRYLRSIGCLSRIGSSVVFQRHLFVLSFVSLLSESLVPDTIVMNFVAAHVSEPGGDRGDHREEQRRRENALAEQQSIGAGHSAPRPQQCPLQRALSRKRSASYFRGWFSNVASPSSPPFAR